MSDKYAVPNKLPGKQVSILAHRRRRQNEEQSHHRVKQLNRKFKLRPKKRNFIKAEAFISAYRKSERDDRRMKRTILSNKVFKKPNESHKLLVAYRHRAHKIASDSTNKMLRKLRLGTLHNAVLLKNDLQTTSLLRLVEPYVIWGYPNIDVVRELVFKHGFLKIKSKRMAINCNKLIEDNLGSHGIICVEDIIHELFEVSEKFNVIKKILLPFRLKAPKDGWKNKTGVSFTKGGEYGFRNDNITSLIERCL